MNGGVIGAFGVAAFCGLLFLFVDGGEVPVLFLRPFFDPMMALTFALFAYVALMMVRSRGRLLVGGDDWIAEYRYYRPFPITNRVPVKKTTGMVLRIEPIRAHVGGGHLKDWVDLAVVQNGRELIRVAANPKWLKDSYHENFEEWKAG